VQPSVSITLLLLRHARKKSREEFGSISYFNNNSIQL